MGNPVSRYVKNVFNAAEKSGDASGITNATQAVNPSKKADSQKAKDATGQLWGAILQNRTYDEKGKIKGSQAGHHVTDSKNHTRTISDDKAALARAIQNIGKADKKK